jgi:ATP-dependent DNA helicase RecQ
VSRSLFGFALRTCQEWCARAVLDGRDTLAVLPTGSGKSAIYQVAGITIGGLTLVVSPLIALQRDQLRSLTTRRHGGWPVGAALLNATQHAHDRQDALDRVIRGDLDFLFVGLTAATLSSGILEPC